MGNMPSNQPYRLLRARGALLHLTDVLLRARRALLHLTDVPLRTRRAPLLYKINSNRALLVLKGTSLICNNALLVLSRRYVMFKVMPAEDQYSSSFIASLEVARSCVITRYMQVVSESNMSLLDTVVKTSIYPKNSIRFLAPGFVNGKAIRVWT